MRITAIDPGPTESAFITLDNLNPIHIIDYGIIANFEVLEMVKTIQQDMVYVVEDIQCMGMPVGKSVFETVKFIGRLQEAAEQIHMPMFFIYRNKIKLYFCGTTRAKDSNIRQVLIDRFGEQGTKLNPGRLYGIKKDIWSALAIAVFWYDTH